MDAPEASRHAVECDRELEKMSLETKFERNKSPYFVKQSISALGNKIKFTKTISSKEMI